MKLVLTNVSDDMARSAIATVELPVGSIVQLKGLAPGTTLAVKEGVALDGEIFEAVYPEGDDPTELYAIVAPDITLKERYSNSYRWNYSEQSDVPAKEAFRCYILRHGDRVTIDAKLIGGVGVVAGDKLAITVGDGKLTKVAGAEKAVVAKVLRKTKIDGVDAYDIIFL